MHVCVCVCMNVCVCVYIYMNVCVCLSVHVCVCVCVRARLYALKIVPLDKSLPCMNTFSVIIASSSSYN